MYLSKVSRRAGRWTRNFWEWVDDNREIVIFIIAVLLIIGVIGVGIAYASGAFFDEVENYDFTAIVVEKDHYTTQTISYVKSGNSTVPVYHTWHHYKIYWEDGGVNGDFEVGQDHYGHLQIGDYVNVHCSVREDKQGELYYYYSYGG